MMLPLRLNPALNVSVRRKFPAQTCVL